MVQSQITDHPTLSAVLNCHKVIFLMNLGVLRGTSVKLCVDPQTRLRFFKYRTVSYSMRGKVEQELDRLQRQGILKPMAFSDWAASLQERWLCVHLGRLLANNKLSSQTGDLPST